MSESPIRDTLPAEATADVESSRLKAEKEACEVYPDLKIECLEIEGEETTLGKEVEAAVDGKSLDGASQSPLHWMWKGFSVDRYAPRADPGSKDRAMDGQGKDFSSVEGFDKEGVEGTRPEDGTVKGDGEQEAKRKQTGKGLSQGLETSPGRSPVPRFASLPASRKRSPDKETVGSVPPGQRKEGWCLEEFRAKHTDPQALPKADGDPGLRLEERRKHLTARVGAGKTGEKERPTQGRAKKESDFETQPRRFLKQLRGKEGPEASSQEPPSSYPTGEATKTSPRSRLRPAPSVGIGKITKLVELRQEFLRKNLEETERKKQEERERAKKEQVKRRKLQREIAARIAFSETQKNKKNRAKTQLQIFRKRDREQAAQYRAELKEMKARVSKYPFLFEKVAQRDAQVNATRIFTNLLKGLNLDVELVTRLAQSEPGDPGSQVIDLEWDAGDQEPRKEDPGEEQRRKEEIAEEQIGIQAAGSRDAQRTDLGLVGPALEPRSSWREEGPPLPPATCVFESANDGADTVCRISF
eukprot:gi/632989949/ref/XP_007883921.1/ PREDICTED: testis-specific protein 10-interacting protein-like [Callorhinchus milii]